MSNNIIPFLVDKNKEKTSIQFIIRKNGLRYRYTPGISVLTKFWIDNNRWCCEGKKYPEGYINNEQIKKYIRIIEDVFVNFDKNLITPTQQLFKETVDEKINSINSNAGGTVKDEIFLVSYIETYIINCDKSTDTYKNYISLLNHLKEYEKKSKIKIRFSEVNLSFYNGFRSYLLSSTYTKGKMERHYSKNYIGSLFKTITKFMNETAGELHNNKIYEDKKFKKERENIESIYLSVDEVKRIFDLNITHETITTYFKDVRPSGITRKIKALNDARLIFLVGCYTGLRISDYSRIIDFNIDEDVIRIRTQKTNKIVFIPIHINLREIMNKTDVMNIKISDQKLNDHIKEIGFIAGINDIVKISRTEGGSIVTRTCPKYEAICSHTARRSFATNAYLSGIDIFIIKEILGHTKIETTMSYLKISEEQNARRISQHPFFKGYD